MRDDIVPGAVLPDYELSDHGAKRRKLSELQGPDPMILVLSRGGFCPKERRQHEGLVQLHRELEVAYCRLLTITTDSIIETNEFRSGVGAHWPFLDLRAVLRKCQPDWDITKSELKAIWQQGKKELFYPYHETYARTLNQLD